MMSENEEAPSAARRRLSCSTCFDALWFCYSPVHQMQQYYRLGVLDNCSGKWTALVDCLTLKTKRSTEVQEILETREKLNLISGLYGPQRKPQLIGEKYLDIWIEWNEKVSLVLQFLSPSSSVGEGRIHTE